MVVVQLQKIIILVKESKFKNNNSIKMDKILTMIYKSFGFRICKEDKHNLSQEQMVKNCLNKYSNRYNRINHLQLKLFNKLSLIL
jgi:hypothetical protein